MNLKLALQLSAFGLIMAFATISLIPDRVEPFFWLVIFCFCAYVVARVAPGKYFLHGFVISLFNCVWIMAAHIGFYNSYAAHHPEMMASMSARSGYFATHPRVLMLVMGPVMGALFGVVQGLFCWIASKLVKRKVA